MKDTHRKHVRKKNIYNLQDIQSDILRNKPVGDGRELIRVIYGTLTICEDDDSFRVLLRADFLNYRVTTDLERRREGKGENRITKKKRKRRKKG